jgi:hypothetical protein
MKVWLIQLMSFQFFMEREFNGVSLIIFFIIFKMMTLYYEGITVKFTGNTGHGSRFIENTAAEKLVFYLNLQFFIK